MLRKKTFILLGGIIALFGMGAAVAIDKRPDSPGPGASSPELVEAAQKVYEGRANELKVVSDCATLDQIYIWSKRWMTAQWDLSLQTGDGALGVKEHFERMEELDRLVKQLHKLGQANQADVAAAAYYRTEAQLMLERVGR